MLLLDHKESLAVAIDATDRANEITREILAEVITSDESLFQEEEERAFLERALEHSTHLKAALELALFWARRADKARSKNAAGNESARARVIGPAANERGVWYSAPTKDGD